MNEMESLTNDVEIRGQILEKERKWLKNEHPSSKKKKRKIVFVADPFFPAVRFLSAFPDLSESTLSVKEDAEGWSVPVFESVSFRWLFVFCFSWWFVVLLFHFPTRFGLKFEHTPKVTSLRIPEFRLIFTEKPIQFKEFCREVRSTLI